MEEEAAAAAAFDESTEREARRAAVLRQIRKLIEFYGVSREELSVVPEASPSSTPPADLPPKYRHPISGDTWDGVGAHPDWLRKALLQEGYRVAELRVADESGAYQPHPPGA